jgi:signal transduction histidine kinase/DNA-binding response OmpR family regulator
VEEMSAGTSTQKSTGVHTINLPLSQLQNEIIWLGLGGLVAAVLIVVGNIQRFPHPAPSLSLAFLLTLMTLVIWYLRGRHYLSAACLLVFSYVAVILFLAGWDERAEYIYLLALPTGLAMLAVGRLAGFITASLCTLWLLFAPPSWLPATMDLRAVTIIGIWGTAALSGMAVRSFVTVAQWAWTSQEQSRQLLEQARDYQLQLRETLEDLEFANVQLTRLNQQAHTLRQEAEEQRRAKEQFVANVSHELRTPLNMIIGFCEMITHTPEIYGKSIPAPLLADLSVVLRNSQHLSELIDDVLDLSQIEAGQMALSREYVSLGEIIEAATVAVHPLYESKGLFLTTEIPSNLPEVFCDPTRIREVVLNLLSNAGRFTEQGGVRLRAWQEDDSVVVSVTDTGPGIAADKQARLFQPYQQVDGTIHHRFGGTGLGLSISKSFVELHQGKMWLESKPGQGTTVFFRLPIEPQAPPAANVSGRLITGWEFRQRTRLSRAPVATVLPRLVLVEQGETLQRLLARYLESVEIVAVRTFDEAIQAIEDAPAQALLINTTDTDICKAIEAVSKVSVLPHDVPVIICSLPSIEQVIARWDVRDYLVKPVTRQKLLAALERLGSEVKTILIVDDEPDALQLFRRMLVTADQNYRVLRASDGQQALEFLRREKIDAMLLDLVMPELDGFQLLNMKRQDESLRDIPTILISARDPLQQPVRSNVLMVTRQAGLSMEELLASIVRLTELLSCTQLSASLSQSEISPG